MKNVCSKTSVGQWKYVNYRDNCELFCKISVPGVFFNERLDSMTKNFLKIRGESCPVSEVAAWTSAVLWIVI